MIFGAVTVIWFMISENKTCVSTECETSEASNDHDGSIETVGK
jgi:hypothetical protein